MDTSARPPTRLPPLILHPLSDAHAPKQLSTSARASLILSGLMPSKELSDEELHRQVLDSRYSEVKMLFYVGKDIERWLEQCMEVVERDVKLRGRRVGMESFAVLLIEDAPAPVRDKLWGWGMVDYKAIFRRAFALHSIFATVPEREMLAPDFLRSYPRYADSLYKCRLDAVSCDKLNPAEFPFDVFSSGEYARLLEREWDRSDV